MSVSSVSNSEVNPGADEIRRAAKSLFAQRGFDSVSLSAIAERADCSKSNIFHHFGSKQALYFDVMRQATERSASRIRQVMADDKDPAARLRETVKDYYTVIAEDPERSRLMMREVMFSSPQRGQELAEEVFAEEFAALTELVADLGGKQPENAEFIAFVLVAANVMYFHYHNVLEHMPGAGFARDSAWYAELVSDLLLKHLDLPHQKAD